jgi:NADH dehydrogenase
MPTPFSGGRPRVVILGAGFGGLRAARVLAGKPVDVLLLDRNNYHVFQPLLYQVATAGLEADQIAHPVRAIVRRHHNVRFGMTHVTAIDLPHQVLSTTDGLVPFDYLIIAAGSATNFFGNESVKRMGFELKDVDHAIGIRNHILTLFEKSSSETDPVRRRQLLTFCIVGGGPTGVEFAGALSELIRLVLVKDYPGLDLSSIRIILLEAGNEVLQAFPARLQESARRVLERKNVEIRFGARVTGMTEDAVQLADAPEIPSKTLIWAAGVRGAAIVDTLGVALARGGRIPVEGTLQMPGHSGIFVIGDLAYLEQDGQPIPMLAAVAMQQGKHAARNILRLIQGRTPEPFRYKDPGSLATIGRNQAVAVFGKLQFTGFIAWFLWLAVHIVNLIGFRNRIMVLINWAWDYFFFDRGVRIITHVDEALAANPPSQGPRPLRSAVTPERDSQTLFVSPGGPEQRE